MDLYVDVDEMPEPLPACPMCGGDGVAMGTLGALLHLRCRQCGMDYSTDALLEEEPDRD